MNLVTTLDQFDEKNVYLSEPIRNSIMNGGNFVRFIYSPNEMTMNGLFFCFPMKKVNIEKHFTKYKGTFNVQDNLNVAQQLIDIEQFLLNKHKPSSIKSKKFMIQEQFSSGSVKLHHQEILFEDLYDTCEFHLRISGIWESDHSYGLTINCKVGNNWTPVTCEHSDEW
jgi:hypothetical protein